MCVPQIFFLPEGNIFTSWTRFFVLGAEPESADAENLLKNIASRLKIQFLSRFTQKSKNAAGKEMEKKSLINIVDLAGR